MKDKLTPAMIRVLEIASYTSHVTHSGRGGWSDNVMRALVTRGLAVHTRDSTWEKWYRITELGLAVGREAHVARLAANAARFR
jgi:hypothetical protein